MATQAEIGIQPLLSYEDLGFSKFLERSITGTATDNQAGGGTSSSQALNFDSVQTTGSLGDKIQVGNIVIDGAAGKITVNDESGNVAVIIGKIS